MYPQMYPHSAWDVNGRAEIAWDNDQAVSKHFQLVRGPCETPRKESLVAVSGLEPPTYGL